MEAAYRSLLDFESLMDEMDNRTQREASLILIPLRDVEIKIDGEKE